MHKKPKPPLFALGQVVMTAGAARLGVDFLPYLVRHATGDWGKLDAFDKEQNDRAVREGQRILSAYRTRAGQRFWVITEWDRSVTTILLPEE